MKPQRTSILILLLLYTVGFLGIVLPIHRDFVLLTPVNLLVSLGLVLWNHERWEARTGWFIVLAYVLGFGAEVFGVQTGLLFGDYAYGRVLGPKLWGTPLMIGMNWVMLGYASGVTANRLLPGRHWLVRGTLAAVMMVALDVLIEPVAMRYGFWTWEGGVVPLRNYIGWFVVALPIECLFAAIQGNSRNKVAVALFILQFFFFLALGFGS